MDKYNGSTCKFMDEDDWFCSRLGRECKGRAKEPQHMHPCSHGAPIVASAIAQPVFWTNANGLVFADVGEHLTAFRDQTGKWSEWHENSSHGRSGRMLSRLPWIRFDDAGLRLPTASQLAAMYADQKGEEQR